jgi:hypothetical protein
MDGGFLALRSPDLLISLRHVSIRRLAARIYASDVKRPVSEESVVGQSPFIRSPAFGWALSANDRRGTQQRRARGRAHLRPIRAGRILRA